MTSLNFSFIYKLRLCTTIPPQHFFADLIQHLVKLLLHLLGAAPRLSAPHSLQRLLSSVQLLRHSGQVILTQREQLALFTLQPVLGLRELSLLLQERRGVLRSPPHRLTPLQQEVVSGTEDKEKQDGSEPLRLIISSISLAWLALHCWFIFTFSSCLLDWLTLRKISPAHLTSRS